MSNPWQWQPDQPSYGRQEASLIRLDGPDSRRFLHGQTSAAIAMAEPGQWISACCISPTARLRALAEILIDNLGGWLVVIGGDGERVHAALDRVLFPADQVRLQAPQPAWLLTPVAGRDETLPEAGSSTWTALPTGSGWQLGSGPLGRALLLLDERDGLPPAWLRRHPLGEREQERWRLQRGEPAAPGELNEDHNPFELGLAARVSLNKGCYVGQETLAKLATYDGVKQQLRRWHWQRTATQHAPQCGQSLHPLEAATSPEAGQPSGEAPQPQRVGRISSLLELDNGDRIGLALVRRSALEAPHLIAGDGGDAARITLSWPEACIAPPGSSSPQGS